MAFQWTSSLSPGECLDRLRRVSEPPRWVNLPSRKDRPPLVLRVKGGDFWVFKNNPYNNLLQPVLKGEIGPRDGGTRIAVRFEVRPLNFWLLAAWYSFLAFLLFFGAPDAAADPGETWRFIVLTAVFIALPTLVWALGAWLSRGEKRFLLEAVSEVLKTGPVLWDDRRPQEGGGR